MKYKTRVWRPFQKDSYRYEWNSKKLVGVLQEFWRDLRRSRERIFKGYCDYDVFSIYHWFLGIMPTMLQEFSDNLHSYPDMSESIAHHFILDEDDKPKEGIIIWKKILSKMILLFKEANEETCTKKNPYEDEYFAAFKEFEKRYGSLGKKLLTEEEKKERQRTGCTRIYFPDDVPEYKEISDRYFEENLKKTTYMKECKDEALALFSQWFDNLWN